jgi:hypothetical protein
MPWNTRCAACGHAGALACRPSRFRGRDTCSRRGSVAYGDFAPSGGNADAAVEEDRRPARDRAYVLGNSHLLATLVSAYCDSAVRERCWADWREMRVSKGSFATPSGRFSYFSEAMSLRCFRW